MGMNSKGKGRRLALLAGVLAVVSLAAAASTLREEIRIWVKLRQDFERLGRGKYKHRETGVVFNRVDGFLVSELQYIIVLGPRSCQVLWKVEKMDPIRLRDWRDIFQDSGFAFPTEKQWRRAKQVGHIHENEAHPVNADSKALRNIHLAPSRLAYNLR